MQYIILLPYTVTEGLIIRMLKFLLRLEDCKLGFTATKSQHYLFKTSKILNGSSIWEPSETDSPQWSGVKLK
jgi:hypothetical protein